MKSCLCACGYDISVVFKNQCDLLLAPSERLKKSNVPPGMISEFPYLSGVTSAHLRRIKKIVTCTISNFQDGPIQTHMLTKEYSILLTHSFKKLQTVQIPRSSVSVRARYKWSLLLNCNSWCLISWLSQVSVPISYTAGSRLVDGRRLRAFATVLWNSPLKRTILMRLRWYLWLDSTASIYCTSMIKGKSLIAISFTGIWFTSRVQVI